MKPVGNPAPPYFSTMEENKMICHDDEPTDPKQEILKDIQEAERRLAALKKKYENISLSPEEILRRKAAKYWSAAGKYRIVFSRGDILSENFVAIIDAEDNGCNPFILVGSEVIKCLNEMVGVDFLGSMSG